MNDSPLIYGAAVLHPAYRWALFDDLWGDDEERQLWITKAKEMVQDLWEREYRDLEVDDPETELPANKRLKTSRNKFTAWRTTGFEIDRIDRFRALIDRFISIERPSQSIDIDRSNRSDRASRDEATKLQNPKKEGGGAPSSSESTQQQRLSTNCACQGCFVGHTMCCDPHRGKIQGSLPYTSPIYIRSTRSTIKSIDQDQG